MRKKEYGHWAKKVFKYMSEDCLILSHLLWMQKEYMNTLKNGCVINDA